MAGPSLVVPGKTTIGDLLNSSLEEAGVIGTGQQAGASEMNVAWSRCQWMLQQWERKRWLVYHLVTYGVTSTGARSYTVGPNGDINTDVAGSPWNAQFNSQFGAGVASPPVSARPDRIESAFLRQITQSQPNQIDYPLRILQSMEDYNRIALKSLVSFPGCVFYDPAWPRGILNIYPVPNPAIYAVFISIKEQLPVAFPTIATAIELPYEYYAAILYNLAIRLRAKFQIPTFPGDPLVSLAKESLNVLRGANVAIAKLQVPGDLKRPALYNIFSDEAY